MKGHLVKKQLKQVVKYVEEPAVVRAVVDEVEAVFLVLCRDVLQHPENSVGLLQLVRQRLGPAADGLDCEVVDTVRERPDKVLQAAKLAEFLCDTKWFT